MLVRIARLFRCIHYCPRSVIYVLAWQGVRVIDDMHFIRGPIKRARALSKGRNTTTAKGESEEGKMLFSMLHIKLFCIRLPNIQYAIDYYDTGTRIRSHCEDEFSTCILMRGASRRVHQLFQCSCWWWRLLSRHFQILLGKKLGETTSYSIVFLIQTTLAVYYFIQYTLLFASSSPPSVNEECGCCYSVGGNFPEGS